MLRVCVVALALSACAEKPPPVVPAVVPACPGAFKELPESLKASGGECACPLGVGSGAVWGSSPYTEDSQVCRAAVHAGAVDAAKGGPVKFKGAPGCAGYKGSAQHDVTSTRWGAFPKSFVFPGHGEQTCPAPVADQCPATFSAIGEPGELFRCTCTKEDVDEGSTVWGSGTYTTDSSLCRAAVHAGAIPPTGGKIAVRPARGCPKYLGSTKNGITTSRWGAYANSFYLEDWGHGECAEAPADGCPDAFPEGADKVSCTCAGESGGAVWGTGIYTRDSSLCAAAVHAGVVPPAGGKLTAFAAKPCEAYQGTTQHGVTTGNWGAYQPGSFVFEAGRGCGPAK